MKTKQKFKYTILPAIKKKFQEIKPTIRYDINEELQEIEKSADAKLLKYDSIDSLIAKIGTDFIPLEDDEYTGGHFFYSTDPSKNFIKTKGTLEDKNYKSMHSMAVNPTASNKLKFEMRFGREFFSRQQFEEDLTKGHSKFNADINKLAKNKTGVDILTDNGLLFPIPQVDLNSRQKVEEITDYYSNAASQREAYRALDAFNTDTLPLLYMLSKKIEEEDSKKSANQDAMNKLDVKEKEIRDLKNRLNTLQSTNTTSAKEILSIKDEYNKTKKLLDQKTREYDNTKKLLDKQTKEYTEAKKQIETFTFNEKRQLQRIDELNKNLRQKDLSISGIREDKEFIERDLLDTQNENVVLRKSLLKTQNEKKELNKSLLETQNEKKELNKSLLETRNEKKELNKSLLETRNEQKELNKSLKKIDKIFGERYVLTTRDINDESINLNDGDKSIIAPSFMSNTSINFSVRNFLSGGKKLKVDDIKDLAANLQRKANQNDEEEEEEREEEEEEEEREEREETENKFNFSLSFAPELLKLYKSASFAKNSSDIDFFKPENNFLLRAAFRKQQTNFGQQKTDLKKLGFISSLPELLSPVYNQKTESTFHILQKAGKEIKNKLSDAINFDTKEGYFNLINVFRQKELVDQLYGILSKKMSIKLDPEEEKEFGNVLQYIRDSAYVKNRYNEFDGIGDFYSDEAFNTDEFLDFQLSLIETYNNSHEEKRAIDAIFAKARQLDENRTGTFSIQKRNDVMYTTNSPIGTQVQIKQGNDFNMSFLGTPRTFNKDNLKIIKEEPYNEIANMKEYYGKVNELQHEDQVKLFTLKRRKRKSNFQNIGNSVNIGASTIQASPVILGSSMLPSAVDLFLNRRRKG